MSDVHGQFGVDETEDVDVIEIQMGGSKVGLAGFARASGTVYLNGDIHPHGAFGALMAAAKQDVPYMYTSAVNALFPSEWLSAECLHDVDRLRVIGNLETFIRRAA